MPKILAIDDISDNLISLKAIVHDAFPGSTVFTALNGPNGIELAIANNPDVILLDIIMPGMDGFEVCRLLKLDEQVNDIPVVFLTAMKGDKGNRIKALEVGAEGFLSKPIDETELTAQIRAMVKIKLANEQKRNEKERLEKLVEERTASLQNELKEREKAEKSLRESEERFQMLFNKAPLGYQSLDFDGHFIEVNQQWLDTLGYSREEVIGKWFGDFLSPDYQNGFRQRFPLFKSLGLIHSEFEMVHKNGTKLFIAFDGRIGYNLNGEFKQTHCILQDVTERKKAEEALKNSLSLTEATLESIHNGILVISHDGTVIKTSKRFVEMWHIPDDVLATGDDKILMNSILEQLTDPDGFIASVIEAYEKPKSETFDLVYFKDGHIFERISKPMYIEGEPKGRVWSFLDITNRKQAEDAFRESQSIYHSFIEQLPSPVFRKDSEGRFILANSQFFKFKGLTEKDMIGHTPMEVAAREIAVYGEQGFATKYASVGEDVHEQIMQTGKIFESEEEYINHSDGTKLYMQVMRMPVIDSHGSIIGTQGIIFDITQRKLAEIAQQEIYKFNNSLLKTIPFGMDIVDEEGNILFQSENLKTLFGGDVTGQRCWKIYRDDKQQCSECPLLKGIEIGKTDFYETHGVLGGKIFEISHTGMMFQGKKAMLEIFMDITERRKTEELIRKNSLTLELAMNTANMAWWEMDMTTGLVTFEKRKAEMLGYPPENFKHYLDFMALVHPDDYDRTMNAMKLHLNGTASKYEVEYRIKAKSGEYNWFYDIGSVVQRDVSGLPLNVAGLVLNISERKRAELELFDAKVKAEEHKQQLIISNKELIKRNKFIQTVLDNLPIGIALNNIDEGIATYMNKKFEEIYGWNSNEITSIASFFEHVYPDVDYRNKLTSQILEDIQSGDLDRMHWENIFVTRKDGMQRVVNAVNIPLFEQDTMVSTVADITDLHKTQNDLLAAKERAEESDRLKSAFLANMSHEIRTPLNSIIGFSELMADPDFDADQQTEFAKIVINSGNSLLTIISDIMDFSKIEAGQININKLPFILQRLISAIEREYSFIALDKGIELRIDPLNPKEDIWIRSDENRVKQVLVNLVGNAIKFTKEGYVELGIRATEDCIQFHVSDTGIGIPYEYHHKIFERFRQVESANSRKYGGNGLGLTISKSLVELLGGSLWLESSPGKGSTFYFTVPGTPLKNID